jgi:DNA-binding Xre family transcriptional regulator
VFGWGIEGRPVISDAVERPAVEKLRENIRVRMARQKVTSIADLARKSGVNTNTLHNFFKEGRKEALYADVLWMISRALDCTMEELITGEPPAAPPARFTNPIIDGLCRELEQFGGEELARLRAVVELYIDQRLSGSERDVREEKRA